MLYIFILSPTLLFLLFPKRFPLYIAVVATMYMFYAYLWVDEHFYYVGKAGWKGFGMFMWTKFTVPFYVLFHLVSIYHGWLAKEKRFIKINIIGLVLCIAHLIAVFS